MDLRADIRDRMGNQPRKLLKPAGRLVLVRYSRFVNLMKRLLPAMAAAILGLLVVWPKLQVASFSVGGLPRLNTKNVDTLSMLNPHYYGTDEKNLPFTITADVATQTDPQNLVVSLEKPVADLTQKSGASIVINSDVGFFRQKDEILDLLGHVDLYQDNGYEVHTESARMQVAQGNATGDQPTHGQGPTGTIEGEGFRLWDRGRVIVFTGKAKAVLNAAKAKSK